MFERLKAWRRRHEIKREIFRYFDGTRLRGADPIIVLLALKSDPKLILDDHPRLAGNGDLEATEICASAARTAFGLTKYDDASETGVTEMEALAVLLEFGRYLEYLKKNFSGSPISPPPSDPKPLDNSTTKDESDCGSTAPE